MDKPISKRVSAQIARVLEGNASSDDRRAVQEWRDQSADNDLTFRELAAIWVASAEAFRLRAPAPSGESPPTAAELLGVKEPPRSTDRSPLRGPSRRKAPVVRRWVVRAASLAAAALIGGLWVQSLGTPLYAEEFVTGPDDLFTATLSDGTVVRLAPSSRLRVEMSNGSRDVWLEGRAFFAVTGRNEQRFVVRTRVGDATVLGTRFGVHARGNDLELAVLQGAVQVTSREGSARIEGGQLGRVQRGTPPSVHAAENLPTLFTWMGSFLAFEDTPLHQVALEVEAQYGVRISLRDRELEGRVVTAWFSEDNVEDVMEVVCRVVSADCSFREDAIEMSSAAGRSVTP